MAHDRIMGGVPASKNGSSCLTVYLGDLRYYTAGTCFPLGLGFLVAYVRQQLGRAVDIHMFIEPGELIDAIRNSPPDILGLANYTWNRNINTQVLSCAKSVSPRIMTLMGGPCFARDDRPWLESFFSRNADLDFYIAGSGELALEEVLRLALAAGGMVESVKEGAFPGLFYREGREIREGARMVAALSARHKDLDIFPSPYLSGTLDKFFSYRNLGPMIETVRGCPYACTFCCWGSRLLNKVSAFSLDRVKAELDYIAERSVNCRRLYFGDANFGLLAQDEEVARYLRDIRTKTGWPDDVYLYLAKNSGQRVINIAQLLRGMTKVSLARQSMSDNVLVNTKRANLSDEDFARVQEELGESQIESMVEIIYPLPGETRTSFIDGMNQIFSLSDPENTEIRLYPTELLPGSEMASTESRQRFGLKTGWRKLSGALGRFSGVSACEYQEIVVATNDFSMADQAYVRKLHFLFTLFLTYRLFEPVTLLFTSHHKGGGIMALINPVTEGMSADAELSTLMSAFERDTMGEFIFGEQPPADGTNRPVDGETGGDATAAKEQKRYNIYYALKLYYGNGGQWRISLFRLMRGLLIDRLGISADKADEAIAAMAENLVDYPSLVSEGHPGELINHPAVAAFLAESGRSDVVNTLYSLYSAVTGGHLDRMVLKRPFVS